MPASQFSIPSLTLPKGGGAIRGIGEKFAANPVTGTASLSIPIPTSPGRAGVAPQLALTYDSGAGNGPFGWGWSLGLASITRKTDKGLPRYNDAEESDVYILSGAEDLVPVLMPDGTRFEDVVTAPGYVIHRYRPRVEGLFARIERWTRTATGEIHWRSITKDNVTTLYGRDNQSRVFDPAELDEDDPANLDKAHPIRIFSWLICASYDDKGNAVVYQYAAENSDNVEVTAAHEANRSPAGRTANRYLKRVLYGNRLPNRDGSWNATDPSELTDWMFEVVLDYGEAHAQAQAPTPDGEVFVTASAQAPADARWSARLDPFSTYRAGFEVRTYRLCRRVLMFHHFPRELGIDDCLVRSTELTYSEDPVASFITGVTQSGYVRQPLAGQPNRYLRKSLPLLALEYSQVPTPAALAQQPIREVDPDSLENLPTGLDGTRYQWLDLDGEGTSGILSEEADGWYYKRNLSANNQVTEDGQARTAAHFGPAELVASKPSVGLAQGAQFLDLAGDGQVDLVLMDGAARGFFERTEDAAWAPFQPFVSWPNLNTHDPDLRFVDLTGDGHADILITDSDALTWYPSLGEDGFGDAIRLSASLDEARGPRLVFADGEQSIYLADLSGDGLSDLVRIRNGEVCYWPNLGYGWFGARVTMDDAPWFDMPDQFDQRRIRLADSDGSGTTDIIYLGTNGTQVYFNQSGNRWSQAVALPQFPPIDQVSSVQALDLLGNGTACLVWSSPLPGDGRRPMRYLALMEDKPHLLTGITNNLGAETRIHYASSTRFYLDDRQGGTPWVTRLPFPVHVVERVETYDRVSRNRFVSRYAYHHGYFDGAEREFRGFGMVEQRDTEEIGTAPPAAIAAEDTNWDAASFVPPVLTRTWFHTGAFADSGRISKQFAHEYYAEPGLSDEQLAGMLLDDTVLPTTLRRQDGTRASYSLTGDEAREACRALKGAILRQEIYALDTQTDGTSTEAASRPYSVSERAYTIELLQPQGPNAHAVFFTHARETVDYHYERRVYDTPSGQRADPRVTHDLTLDVDGYGNVLRTAAIAYGRRFDAGSPALLPQDRDVQRLIHITYTDNRVTNAVDDVAHPHDYRAPLLAEARTYELRRPVQERSSGGLTRLYRLDDLAAFIEQASDGAHDIEYEDRQFSKAQQAVIADGSEANRYFRRLIEHARTLYRKDDLTALLPLGSLDPMALTGESYRLAFTTGLLAQVFQREGQALLPDPALVLGGQGGDRGGYVNPDSDGRWWIPSGRVFYATAPDPAAELAFARTHFFLPHRFRDVFGQPTDVAYDSDDANAQRNHNLLVVRTEDAVGNRIIAANDYRVLLPFLITDPNQNRSQAAFDALGMLVGTAVMGKAAGPLQGDNLDQFIPDLTPGQLAAYFDAVDPRPLAATHLGTATTRFLYDLERVPACAASMARETHVSDLPAPAQSRLQLSFGYSDGFGREVQNKVQAEPGPVPLRQPDGTILVGADGLPEMTPQDVSPRWVGTGWTVFNNKGMPVRKYEPFFTDTHRFEVDARIGVSPTLFYDPVGRAVATLHPDHTWQKTVFDPWQQETWDAGDTVALNPATDFDAGGFFDRLPDAAYLPTWYALRTDPAHAAAFAARYPDPAARTRETAVARKAEAYAGTPSVAHFDTLGRTFVTFADNGVDPVQPDRHRLFATRVELDIEGNERTERDAIVQNGDPSGRLVMRYDYDMLGNRIHQASMEAGERWTLNDVTGKPIRAWDSRGFARRLTYDALRRPLAVFVSEDDAPEFQAEKTEYGESKPNPEVTNHRGKLWKQSDGAGVVTSEAYDFKGNLLRTTRQFLADYKTRPNWLLAPVVAAPGFTGESTHDALNRPLQVTSPDGSVYRPTFNEANLLDRVEVNLRGETDGAGQPIWTSFVKNINYNAKAQRVLIEYGSGVAPVGQGVITTYEYDPLTFHLTHLKTTRPAGPNGLASQIFTAPSVVQDLNYTYDPLGNITRIEDRALKTLTHNNQLVEPVCSYTYDALYRLIEAQGREHIGQTAHDFAPPNRRDFDFAGLTDFVAHPNDTQAMRVFIENYDYDAVGNFRTMRHTANGGSWTRTYEYSAPSRLEPTKRSNRLTRAIVGNGANTSEIYTYTDTQGNDLGGCITAINTMAMGWDFKNQLAQVDLAGGGTAYYIYDALGQRVRKVIESQNGTPSEERLYLGGFEVYRKLAGANAELVRETLHVMDDKQRIALVETRNDVDDGTPKQVVRYQMSNHLGSASVELDGQGALIGYEEYHPYGTTAFQAGRSAAEVALKRYRYTGKERDEETGFSYHGARYYAPWLGRWTSPDPAGLNGGINLYRYVSDEPIALHDPDGGEEKSFWSTFKPGGRVFETVDKVVNPKKEDHPALAAVMNNLDKRGKDLVEGTTQKLKETAEDYADIAYYSTHSNEAGAKQKLQAANQRRSEAPLKDAVGMAKGFGQMVKRVGEAGGDIAYYSTHSNEQGASAKIANAATDIVLDGPQIVLTVEGAAGLAKGAAGAIPRSAPKPPTTTPTPKPVFPEPTPRPAPKPITPPKPPSTPPAAAPAAAVAPAEAAVGSAAPSAASPQYFQIGEGVRRSVAARELGQLDVEAVHATTRQPLGRIPLDQLLSPKSAIVRDPRFQNVLRGVGGGNPAGTPPPPPIEVTPLPPGAGPGPQLTPVPQVRLLRWRGP
ncbi:MAG: SpvB/TcaC N-terminal domain-containing protein [Anaerolineae bacterium]